MDLKRHLPFLDLRQSGTSTMASDALAALAVTFIAVPQCVAYALIAGLPPAMGLYAAAVPTIVGSLMRSSKHVITGPSNAVSLLVGGGVAAMSGVDPVQIGLALAMLVGTIQLAAGLLRLGAVVDYISNPVVLGYITGAGLLIGVGQVHNITATTGGKGSVYNKLSTWVEGIGMTSPTAVALALWTIIVILGLRAWDKRIPGAIIALGGATAMSMAFGLGDAGMKVVSDLSPVPTGLPPLTLPDLSLFPRLVPLAVACTVLSLVESSAVARAIAAKSGQRLNTDTEFAGQGLANIAASLFGGYPTSGSLGRSALNAEAGAKSRLGGVFAGLMMIAVLLFLGPIVNHTPIASLAGLLMVLAVDLVNVARIKVTLRSTWGDRLAFLATLIGTWLIPLDKAIYVGVGISIVLFLRQARVLAIRELVIDTNGHLQEASETKKASLQRRCRSVHVLHVEGRLFFGAAGELQAAFDKVFQREEVRVLVVRLKRARGMDITIARVFEDMALRMAAQDRHLILAGVRAKTLAVLEATGSTKVLGPDKILLTQSRWFVSMREALSMACGLAERPDTCGDCPLKEHLATGNQTRIGQLPPDPAAPDDQCDSTGSSERPDHSHQDPS